ncbi:hypothetical protein, partial [Neisseria meningitidis]|uniref:hypothetical protein n=1 Tax=Neisseria meningitidis TaxID=487 RepID=UPI001EE7491A
MRCNRKYGKDAYHKSNGGRDKLRNRRNHEEEVCAGVKYRALSLERASSPVQKLRTTDMSVGVGEETIATYTLLL